MRPFRRFGALGVLIVFGIFGCGPRSAYRPAPGDAGCGLARAAEPADTVSVSVFDPIDPSHVPSATTDAERTVFGHLYETLVALDCDGAARPGLAASWRISDGGRRVELVLRKHAAFADGTPVGAGDVVASWRPAIARGAGVDSVNALDAHRVEAFLENPSLGVEPLASTALAVTKPLSGSAWSLGTGPYRIASADPECIVLAPRSAADGPVVRFLATPRAAARDRLDGSVDAMVVADPAVVDYARRRRFTVAPLDYDRCYVLISTRRVEALAAGDDPRTIPPSITESLARDAVRAADARGPVAPAWWNGAQGCGELAPLAPWQIAQPSAWRSSRGIRRVLYDAGDPTARDLADRVVALAAIDPAASPEADAVTAAVPGIAGPEGAAIAAGVSPAELESSLREGADVAYIVVLPSRPPDVCGAARALLRRAPWLTIRHVTLSDALVPLAETRSTVIVVTGRISMCTDGRGDVRVTSDESGKGRLP